MRIDEATYKAMPTDLRALFTKLPNPGSTEVVGLFPETGKSTGGMSAPTSKFKNQGRRGEWKSAPVDDENGFGFGDSGSAARFFYCAKASPDDRNSGLDSYKYVIIEWTQTDKEVRSWESEAQKVQLLVAMDQSRLKVIGVSGAQHNDVTEWNMMLNGSVITEKSRKDTTYITKTGTSSIIESKILSCFQSYFTSGSIQDANGETELCGSHAENAANGTLSIVTINERMALALGAGRVQSPMRLRISVSAARSGHPTVKPTSLMRYLCRLITPPGGVVLDPFMGSGSTGLGAWREGFRFIGIEREAEYFTLAIHRLRAAQRQPDLFHEAGKAEARELEETE